MYHFLRVSYHLPLLMLVALPWWITFGRHALGSYGSNIAASLLLGFIVFLGLILAMVLLRTRGDVRSTKTIGSLDAVLLMGLYISVFLHGFFVVDDKDDFPVITSTPTPADDSSIATQITGNWFMQSSENLGWFFFFGTVILVAVSLMVFAYERYKNLSIEVVVPRLH